MPVKYRYRSTGKEYVVFPNSTIAVPGFGSINGNDSREVLDGLGFDLVEIPEEPPPVEKTELELLIELHPLFAQRVQETVTLLMELKELGVQINFSAGLPGWVELGTATIAAKQAAATPELRNQITDVADAANSRWSEIVTWCGTFADAYRLVNQFLAQ